MSSSWRNISFVVVGLVLLAWAFVLYGKNTAFLNSYEPATGEVTGFVEDASIRAKTKDLFPTISFTTKEGRFIEFVSNVGESLFWHPDIGEKVPLIYNPASPELVFTNFFIYTWGGTIAIAVLGLFLAAAGIGLILIKRWNTPTHATT